MQFITGKSCLLRLSRPFSVSLKEIADVCMTLVRASALAGIAVGTRHGSPRVLIIQAKAMHDDGRRFYLSQNGVWLTEAVPKEYIELAA